MLYNSIKLAVVALTLAVGGNLAAQDCGCGETGHSFGHMKLFGHGGNFQHHCGRGISQADAVSLWSGYCNEDCNFDSEPAYSDAPCGCLGKRHRSGCGCLSKLHGGKWGGKRHHGCGCLSKFHGGCKLRGLFGHHHGCGGAYTSVDTGFDSCGGDTCGGDTGCGSCLGGLFGNHRHHCGSGCLGGLFGHRAAGCGCGCKHKFKNFFANHRHRHQCGFKLFKHKKRCCKFHRSRRMCGHNGAYFQEAVGFEYGNDGIQSCVAGCATQACCGASGVSNDFQPTLAPQSGFEAAPVDTAPAVAPFGIPEIPPAGDAAPANHGSSSKGGSATKQGSASKDGSATKEEAIEKPEAGDADIDSFN